MRSTLRLMRRYMLAVIGDALLIVALLAVAATMLFGYGPMRASGGLAP